MTDRYANGDPSNDRGGLTGTRAATGYDPSGAGWFHGGDLAGLTGSCESDPHGLARIKALGFTSIWITPPFGQKAVQGDSAAYHGYWITDFTAPDRHLGTAAEFGAMVECAHRLGLEVILDVVVNHTADVISLTGGSGGYVGPEQVPYRDCRGKAFHPARTSASRSPAPAPARCRGCLCCSAPTAPRRSRRGSTTRPATTTAATSTSRRATRRASSKATSSASTTCSPSGATSSAASWPSTRPGSSATRSMGSGSTRRATSTPRSSGNGSPGSAPRRVGPGVRDFAVFGEVFDADTLALYPFVRDRGLPSLLDFPLQDQLVGYASGERGSKGIVSVLSDDDYFQLGNGVAYTPPTFLGNHDMGRVGLLLRQRSGDDATLLRRDLLAHSLLYLLRGAPVVYYGDEVGMMGSGGDKLARQDMFPTGWPNGGRRRASARPRSEPPRRSTYAIIRSRAARAARRAPDAHPALATGPSAVRLASGPLLVVSRFDRATRHEYLAAFNAGTRRASATVQTATPGSTWSTLLGEPVPAQTSPAGKLTLPIPPLAAVLLRADAALPSRPPVRPTLVVRPDELTDLVQARATVATLDPVPVAFAVQRGSSAWTRVAADDSPPYRGFLEPKQFRRGERVRVVALARWPDGTTTVSPVVTAVPRPR